MELVFSNVLLVGDTHANAAWWSQVVAPAAERLGVDAIVQLGDFGWWSNGSEFLETVAAGMRPVWFLDGNHEHHDILDATVRAARVRDNIASVTEPVLLTDNIGFLPRGSRFTVSDKSSSITVAAVGGAHSIDRAHRALGRDLFTQERLNNVDIANAAAGGHADVLLCHDAPAGWVIPGLLPERELPRAWVAERGSCEEHRMRLREVFEALTPSHVVHGHYHSPYGFEVEEPWGIVSVDGLDCDFGDHSLATLSCYSNAPLFNRVCWQ